MKRGGLTGFTLVEMLVAISLLGVLGIISWRGLDHVIDQRIRISEQDEQVERLIRTVAQLERDFDERVADALLADPVESLVALPRSVTIERDAQSRESVTIVRRHPSGAGHITVRYRLDGDDLVRLATSPALAQPDRVLLLPSIVAFRIRLLSQSGWVDLPEQADSRAAAIEVSIERASGERYTKVMPL